MSEWQPIETAPKDGSPLLVWCPGCKWKSNREDIVTMGYWYQPGNPERDGYWTSLIGTQYKQRPTHWMPLPEPPKE